MVKKGDTLIEVTIAVGIFSMVAIAIVAVMSGGTSSAQTALETTLAREEIDSQAEALRFIQASYVAVKGTDAGGTSNFARLWEAITKNAIDLSSSGVDKAAVLQYKPSSCAELYKGNPPALLSAQNAFVINTHKINAYAKLDPSQITASQINEVLIPATSKKLIETTTYPRLVFKQGSSGTSDEAALADDSFPEELREAAGIYVVAVKDNNTTSVISDSSASSSSAFYDFYIRTCWYGTNADEPSTISTVIRLYNPLVIKEN